MVQPKPLPQGPLKSPRHHEGSTSFLKVCFWFLFFVALGVELGSHTELSPQVIFWGGCRASLNCYSTNTPPPLPHSGVCFILEVYM